MKLFCFPYAGGSSVIFNQWKPYIAPGIKLMGIELAGRGKRFTDPHYNDFNELINDVFSIIKNEISGGNEYALFGHSLGAKIVYELANNIIKNGLPAPKKIIFSGRGAPCIAGTTEKQYHLLSEEEFKKEVFNLGGTPKEFFENPELLEVLLPMLRNDFMLAERDTFITTPNPLPIDIDIFLGKEESLTNEQIDGWKKHTSKKCTIHFFNGGHFFINENIKEVVEKINSIMQFQFFPITT